MTPHLSYLDLPTFRRLPIHVAVDSLTGYLYGRIVKVNPILTMAIFAIRALAETCLYQIANFIFSEDTRSHTIYIWTALPVNMVFIIVLKELNLMGHLSTIVLSLLAISMLIQRVKQIQAAEIGAG